MVGQLELDVRPLAINPALLAVGKRLRLPGCSVAVDRWLFAGELSCRASLPTCAWLVTDDLLKVPQVEPHQHLAVLQPA